MNIKGGLWMVALLSVCLLSCETTSLTRSGLNMSDFQTEKDGKQTNLYVLKNKNGMEVCVTNYGARVVSIMAPDRDGKLDDVVNGFATVQEYMSQSQNFGATVGRYIGRILNATFTLDSVTYNLTRNTGIHSAHGGNPGFAARIWDAEQFDASSVRLKYLSPDGENGFPGNLDVTLIYRLTDDNALDISYEAQTDKPTVVNLSHHSFFNISGNLSETIMNEILYINADCFTPYDSTKCVTGEFATVEGTPLDFTTPQRIGNRIDDDHPQLNITRGGYDHCWVLNTNGDVSELAASVYDEVSGRVLEIYTNEPGLQIYTAGGLKGTLVGKNGIAYPRRNSICLEAMHFQDSPNKPQFPSTVLRPGETYSSRCVYRFSVR